MNKTVLAVLAMASCTFAQAVINDSAGVTVDLGGAVVMHRSGVAYPRAALTRGVRGIVVVEATLDSTGNVSDARVLSGPEELRSAALQSVLQWHFARDGAGQQRQVTIHFDTPPARTEVAVMGAMPGPSKGPVTTMAGRTVRMLSIGGLPESVKQDLLSRLPLHEGTVATQEQLDRAQQIVTEFDEHLMFSAMPIKDTEMVVSIRAGSTMVPTTMGTAISKQAMPGQISVGGNVQQAKLVAQPRPVYPPDAKAARIQGVVKLAAVIAKDGTVKSLEVISGHPLLIGSAMDAVRQWVYQTTLLNGDPVEVLTQIDVNYTLSQ